MRYLIFLYCAVLFIDVALFVWVAILIMRIRRGRKENEDLIRELREQYELQVRNYDALEKGLDQIERQAKAAEKRIQRLRS